MDEITSNKAAVPGSPQPFDRRWAVLAIIAVAQLMTALDATIVNIALPSAQHSQGFDDSGRDLCRRRRRHGMVVSRQPAGAPGALRRAGRPAGVVHHRHRRHPPRSLSPYHNLAAAAAAVAARPGPGGRQRGRGNAAVRVVTRGDERVMLSVAARLRSIALAWTLSVAPNVLLIPGTSSLQHLEEDIAVATSS